MHAQHKNYRQNPFCHSAIVPTPQIVLPAAQAPGGQNQTKHTSTYCRMQTGYRLHLSSNGVLVLSCWRIAW